MKKNMEVKNSLCVAGVKMKNKLQMKAIQAVNKLKEQDGGLLEYLEESVIGVVLLGIIIAGIVLIVTTIVLPQLGDSIKSAFTVGAK